MVIGVVLLIIGYFCIAGGAAENPEQFNPEVFNTRRIVVAPILILLGLVTEIFAIMWRPKVKEDQTEEKAE
jgi:Ca2+/H+ antiporter